MIIIKITIYRYIGRLSIRFIGFVGKIAQA